MISKGTSAVFVLRLIFKEFTMRHREMIVEYLTTTDNPVMAAASIKAFARPFLDDRQFAMGSCELDRLISNFPLFKKT